MVDIVYKFVINRIKRKYDVVAYLFLWSGFQEVMCYDFVHFVMKIELKLQKGSFRFTGNMLASHFEITCMYYYKLQAQLKFCMLIVLYLGFCFHLVTISYNSWIWDYFSIYISFSFLKVFINVCFALN